MKTAHAFMLSLMLTSATSVFADEPEVAQSFEAQQWHEQVAGMQSTLANYKKLADDMATLVVNQDPQARDHKLYLSILQSVSKSVAELATELAVLDVEVADTPWNEAQASFDAVKVAQENAVSEFGLLEGRYNDIAPKSPGDGTWESVEEVLGAVSTTITALQEKLNVLSLNHTKDASTQALAKHVQAQQDLVAQLAQLVQHPQVEVVQQEESAQPSSKMDRRQMLTVGGIGALIGVVLGYALANK